MSARFPILYQVHSRIMMRQISDLAEVGTVTLADFPASEIDRLSGLGFTHVWLMGVWQVGKDAREIALQYWRKYWRTDFPSKEEDVQGSPFAIEEYAVDSRLGQPLDLLLLKERLNQAGIKLILDFVPNHYGLDSSEPARNPDRFVQAPSPLPGTFSRMTRFGTRFFAHGRDPYFPPWSDTVQLDYRNRETQEMMTAIGQTISRFGNGLRCDMAMLLLPEIFGKVWIEFPPADTSPVLPKFWPEAIAQIRQLQPEIDLIAEVYWDREAELQEAGFDYTYNKRVTDYIVRGEFQNLKTFLYASSINYLKRSVHFLENHDEARIASLLSLSCHKAAAALILFLPGMALLHDGQLEGRKRYSRIQVIQRPPEDPDPEIQSFYLELLATLQKTHIRSGEPMLLHTDSPTLIVLEWKASNGETDFGIVNLTKEIAEWSLPDGANHNWNCLYSSQAFPPPQADQLVIPGETALILRISAGST